jgi:hypothetical protein
MGKKSGRIVNILFVLSILLLIVFTTIFFIPLLRDGLCPQNRFERAFARAREQAFNKIISYTAEYQTKDTVFAQIRYTEPDARFIPAIDGSVNLFYPLLLADFNLPFDEAGRLQIVLFPSQTSLENAIGRRYSYVPMGVYFGGIINIVSPHVWLAGEIHVITDRFIREGPMIHEMAHFVLDIKTNGNYPLWFTEGVALFYEYKYAAFEWRPDLKHEASLLCAAELTQNFRSHDESLSYRKVFDIIDAYVSAHGERGLQAVIRELSQGVPYSEALAVILDHYMPTPCDCEHAAPYSYNLYPLLF